MTEGSINNVEQIYQSAELLFSQKSKILHMRSKLVFHIFFLHKPSYKRIISNYGAE